MYLMKRLILILLICIPVKGWSADLHYTLDVYVNIKEQKITGTARLQAGAEIEIDLSLGNLQNLKVDGKDITTNADGAISLTVKNNEVTVINYEAHIGSTEINVIDEHHLFLNGGWYPKPDLLAVYDFSVTLPKDFIATSEAETVTVLEHDETKTLRFHFSHPRDSVHLAASTRYIFKRDRYRDIDIEAYFFQEDVQLVEDYIDYTKRYMKMYEDMLTPYPYKRFAIVENIFPTGYSMPTFTLLGRSVVRLPFIVKTSLGHEILHEWFGNFVYIDFSHGNWAEGITTYLADHHYADLEQRGAAYRKQIMVDYQAYVNPRNAIPVSDFQSRSTRALGAVGYGKTAMLFHGLRRRYGDETFYAALREFIRKNSFREASWHDIQRAFEGVTGEKLYGYFENWLTRKEIPKLVVENSALQVEQGKLRLNFTISQGGKAFPLQIPVKVYTGASQTVRTVEVKDAREEIGMTLDELPARVVIDEDYELMRHLAPEESPPVLADIMGKRNLIAVVGDKDRDIYQPLIEGLGNNNISYATTDEITFAKVRESSLIIAGYDNSMIDMLFGKQAVPDEGARLRVYKNPYNPSERIMLVHARDREESEGVRHKISHYGKYSELAFNRGKNSHKAIAETSNGIHLFSRPPTGVLMPGQSTKLDDIIPRLFESRIIYVGEQHDRFAHHFNQLHIIKKLHEAGYRVAVGMEMFQTPYQQAVDDYLAGLIDEKTFLRESEYFNKWRYDYNLYKPIIDYLKQEKIPLVALNVEGDIVRKVGRKGIHSLSGEEKEQFPLSMDFSDEQYRHDLEDVFHVHAEQQDHRDFNYFLQAQSLWDEGMAETAHRFLLENPGYSLVVLTGNGHVRHKYGIPERLHRRNNAPYTVVIQDDRLEEDIADYLLLTTELKGRTPPRLGVMIEERESQILVSGVSHKTPAEDAGIKKGDIIEELAGQSIRSLADLKIALFYIEVGSTVKVKLKRDDKILDKEIHLFGF